MLEEKLKKHIISIYGSVRHFALKIDMPYTTVDAILKRGIYNSSVGNVLKICKALGISLDTLIDNELASIYDDELDILYFETKEKLTVGDKNIIKTVIEERKKVLEKS